MFAKGGQKKRRKRVKKSLFGLFLAVLVLCFVTPAMAETTLSPAAGNYSGAVCVRASSDDATVKSFNYFKDGRAISVTTCLMLSGGAYTVKAVGFDEKGVAVADEEAEGSYTAGTKVTADTFGSTDDAFGYRHVTVTVTKKGGGKKATKSAAPTGYRPTYRAVSGDESHQTLLMKKCVEFGTDDEGNPVCKKYADEEFDAVTFGDQLLGRVEDGEDADAERDKKIAATDGRVDALESDLAATKPKAKPGMQLAYAASYSDLGLVHGGEAAVKYCYGRLCPIVGGGLGSTGEATEYKVFGGTLVPFGADVDGVFLAEARFRRGDVDADTVGARAGLQLGLLGPLYVEPSLFLGDEDGKFSVSGQAAAGFRF